MKAVVEGREAALRRPVGAGRQLCVDRRLRLVSSVFGCDYSD
jgi:hypothetical protein